MATFNSHNRKVVGGIICFVALVIGIVFGISLCSSSNKTAYEPIAEKGKGFIGKANALFAELLAENTAKNINARSLSDLNRKYPAFVFDVPDLLNSDLNINDIRLVGIKEDSIKGNYRDFYESSDLRNLLKQQQLNKDKAIFKISIKKKDGHLTIDSIKMIRSLHKIKFANRIWEGDILAQFYNPINEENSRFLIYGSSVLPVRLQEHKIATENDIDNYDVYLLNDNEHGKGLFWRKNNKYDFFDLYDHYTKHYKSNSCFNLRFEADRTINNQAITIQILRDSLIFDLDASLILTCVAKNTQKKVISEAAGNEKRRIFCYSPDSENIRIIVEKSGGHKLAEFQIAKHNPLEKLAYVINTNKGKTRKQIDPKYTDIFTQQVVDVFLKNVNEEIVPKSVSLSIDPLLSQALEKELEIYGKSFTANGLAKNEHFEISMCVVNTATGEILAAPYYKYTPKPLSQERKMSKRNPNMVRRYIGSCFKPIMTLASTQLYPELLNLTTGSSSRRISLIESKETYKNPNNGKVYTRYNAKLLNCPFFQTFSAISDNARAHYTMNHDLKSYLASSNDVFPVVLAMYSFTKFPDFNPLSAAPTDLRTYIEQQNEQSTSPVSLLYSHRFRYEYPLKSKTYKTADNTFNAMDYNIHKSAFVNILATLYSIKSEAVINTDSIDQTPARYLLRYLNDSIVFDEISPDYTNMNYYNWNKKEGQTFRNEVVPWVLGQGTNEWAPLKLAEAWARMITKFPLRLSYIHNENTNEIYKDSILYKQISGKYKTGGDRFNVWNAFLDTLLAAQKVASQDMIYPAYNQLRRIADSLIIIGKTGTPDDFVRADWEHFDISGKIKYDVGLYSFSLMTEKQYQRLKNNISTPKDSTQNAGITCIIRIVHSYPKDKPYKLLTNFPDGIMSYDARNFLLKEQYDGKPKKDFSNTRLRKILFYTDKLFR